MLFMQLANHMMDIYFGFIINIAVLAHHLYLSVFESPNISWFLFSQPPPNQYSRLSQIQAYDLTHLETLINYQSFPN